MGHLLPPGAGTHWGPQGSLLLNPVTENKTNTPKLQSWEAGGAGASRRLSPRRCSEPSRVGHTLDPYLVNPVMLGARFGPLEPCFHTCRWPVRFPIAPQFRIVSQPPGQRCGSCSRQETPRPPFPRWPLSSKHKTRLQVVRLRIPLSLHIVSKPDVQRTGQDAAQMPKPASLKQEWQPLSHDPRTQKYLELELSNTSQGRGCGGSCTAVVLFAKGIKSSSGLQGAKCKCSCVLQPLPAVTPQVPQRARQGRLRGAVGQRCHLRLGQLQQPRASWSEHR